MSRAGWIAALVAVAAGIGVVAVLVTDEERSREPALATTVTQHELWRVRHEIEYSGERRIGHDFACAVVYGNRLRIFVASEDALVRAEAVRRGLAVAAFTDLGVVPARFRRATMLRLRDDILASVPRLRSRGSLTIGMATSNGPRCSPVDVAIRGRPEPWSEWRQSVVARYGSDRVRFRVTPPMSHDAPNIDAGIEDR